MPIRARGTPVAASVQVASEPLTEDNSIVCTPKPALLSKEESWQRSTEKFTGLLPVPEISMSPAESETVLRQQQAISILGPAGAAPVHCTKDCPFQSSCSLAQLHKMPVGHDCPLESNYVVQRFIDWMKELDRTEETLSMSERFAVSQLVSYDLELWRCRRILAEPKAAALKSISVKDVNVETGEPLCWEEVVAIAAQREDMIVTQMRMLMKDFELTPEQKTKRARALGLRLGDDMGSRQSQTWEKLERRHEKEKVVDV